MCRSAAHLYVVTAIITMFTAIITMFIMTGIIVCLKNILLHKSELNIIISY